MLARRPTPEIEPGDEDRGALVHLLIEGVLGILLARVFEGVLSEPVERHRLEVPGRDDAVGIDVIAGERNSPPHDLVPGGVQAHRIISRTSATAPLIAAAATIAGLIKRVRPWGLPCRPMKFRLLEDAQTSRPCSLSSFMPRHIEQPALRHSKPASRNTSWSPSASASLATSCEPGTTMARTVLATRRPLATAAATRRSEMRELVHEPMNTTSIFAPAMGWPASKPMWARPSRYVGRSGSGADSGDGIRSPTPTDCPGLMPQVTIGEMALPSSRLTSS